MIARLAVIARFVPDSFPPLVAARYIVPVRCVAAGLSRRLLLSVPSVVSAPSV
jgi:hypothetical protein